MRVVLSRNDLARLPRLIADAQKAGPSLGSKVLAREAVSSARRRALTRGRGLRSLRLTTEPVRSDPDRTMLIAFLLGFLAGLTFMFLIGQGARSRRRSDQGRIDDRLADMAPSDAEATADTTEEGETEVTEEAQATDEGEEADSELVGVMTHEQSRDGNAPTEPEQAIA
jgi:hypothetical protein